MESRRLSIFANFIRKGDIPNGHFRKKFKDLQQGTQLL
jgi:hypothetical protein